MHLLLTDRLTCPRCGPEFGLILLAERVTDDRRVLEGVLGCPNCRDRFPVRGGFGDLRAPPRTELEPWPPDDAAPDPDETTRLAALLGVARGPGHLVLAGPVVAHAAALADTIEEIEVVAVSPELVDAPERAGVSRITARPGLPFFSRTIRGVALAGDATERFLEEAARVVAPMGRVVVLDAAPEARRRLEATGLSTVLDEAGVVVATR